MGKKNRQEVWEDEIPESRCQELRKWNKCHMCDTASGSTFSPLSFKKKKKNNTEENFVGGFNDSDPQIDSNNPKASKSRW